MSEYIFNSKLPSGKYYSTIASFQDIIKKIQYYKWFIRKGCFIQVIIRFMKDEK